MKNEFHNWLRKINSPTTRMTLKASSITTLYTCTGVHSIIFFIVSIQYSKYKKAKFSISDFHNNTIKFLWVISDKYKKGNVEMSARKLDEIKKYKQQNESQIKILNLKLLFMGTILSTTMIHITNIYWPWYYLVINLILSSHRQIKTRSNFVFHYYFNNPSSFTNVTNEYKHIQNVYTPHLFFVFS